MLGGAVVERLDALVEVEFNKLVVVLVDEVDDVVVVMVDEVDDAVMAFYEG